MATFAYCFLPCDDGEPRENSRYTTVADAGKELEVGRVRDADIFGCRKWRVVPIRQDRGPLISVTDADGTTRLSLGHARLSRCEQERRRDRRVAAVRSGARERMRLPPDRISSRRWRQSRR